MPTVPTRKPSRQITTRAASPRDIGTANLPGPDAFGAAGARVLAQNSEVMQSLAEKEIRQIENQSRIKFQEDLANFRIESIQRVDEISQNRDPERGLMEQTMEDFEERKNELLNRQPQFVKPAAAAQLSALQVNVAQSAIAEQERITQQEIRDSYEAFSQTTLTRVVTGDLSTENAVAQGLDFLGNIEDEDVRENLQENFFGQLENMQIDRMINNARTEGDADVAIAGLQDPDNFTNLNLGRRMNALKKLRDKKVRIREQRAKALEAVFDKAETDPGGAAPVAAGVLFESDPEVFRKISESGRLTKSTQRQLGAVLEAGGADDMAELVASNAELSGVVQERMGVLPSNQRVLSKAEAESVYEKLKDAAQSQQGLDRFLATAILEVEGFAGRLETVMSPDQARTQVLTDLASLSDIDLPTMSLLFDALDRQNRHGDEIGIAAYEALRREVLDPGAKSSFESLKNRGFPRTKIREAVQSSVGGTLQKLSARDARAGGFTADRANQRFALVESMVARAADKEKGDLALEDLAKDALKQLRYEESASRVTVTDNSAFTLEDPMIRAGLAPVLTQVGAAVADTPSLFESMSPTRIESILGVREVDPLSGLADAPAEGRAEGEVRSGGGQELAASSPSANRARVLFSEVRQALVNQMGVVDAPNDRGLVIVAPDELGNPRPVLFRVRGKDGEFLKNKKGDFVEEPLFLPRDLITEFLSEADPRLAPRGFLGTAKDALPFNDPLFRGRMRTEEMARLLEQALERRAEKISDQ